MTVIRGWCATHPLNPSVALEAPLPTSSAFSTLSISMIRILFMDGGGIVSTFSMQSCLPPFLTWMKHVDFAGLARHFPYGMACANVFNRGPTRWKLGKNLEGIKKRPDGQAMSRNNPYKLTSTNNRRHLYDISSYILNSRRQQSSYSHIKAILSDHTICRYNDSRDISVDRVRHHLAVAYTGSSNNWL